MNKTAELTENLDLTYSLAPDLEIVYLGADEWFCQSATSSSKLGGPSARFVIERVMPLLQDGCAWSRLVELLPTADPVQLGQTLRELVASGFLRCYPGPPPRIEPRLAPLLHMLDALHVPADVATERLRQARIAIVGLEGVGAHLALQLAQLDMRNFVLIDPFPCQPGNLPLLPSSGPENVGQPRQELSAAAIRAASPAPQDLAITLGPANLSAAAIAELIAGCACVVSCFDQGFAASHHWVNRASLRAGIPAIYAETRGHQGWAGPLVLPGQTPCYMCGRMRAVACALDSPAALAHEQYRDQQRLPRLHDRAVLPTLMPQIAALLATTVLQVALAVAQPALAGRVLECQALTMNMTMHTILRQPGCPDCQRGDPGGPAQPNLAELRAAGDHAVDILQLAPQLISPRTGLVREVRRHEKDDAEPALPYICEAKLPNYHFQNDVPEEDLTTWGKGLTYAAARAGALGEAVERYAGDWVDPAAIVYARRAELDGPSLDPADLVLYAPEQYANLPYQPYAATSVLGWVRGRSLVSGQAVYIPALGAFMGYQAQRPAEDLFAVNSNGLAAGGNLARAILAATYEVLERDAFMITWFARLPTRRGDPFTHPDAAIRALCQAYQRRGVEIGLWRLPSDHPCAIFLALSLEQPTSTGPALLAGLGADLDPATAARKAILEVGQIRPSYRRSLRRASVRQRIAELVADPQLVTTMHDHALLYCSPLMRHAVAFLLDQRPAPVDWTPAGTADPITQLERLVEHFRARQGDLLYYNLTPPDLADLGLAAVRVILPGFQPVAFGAREPRLGGARLYELPQQLGLAPARLRFNDLNPYPHLFD